MHTLNFPNCYTQTYPSYSDPYNAAKAMGGDVKIVNSSTKIYVFIPKNKLVFIS